MSQLNYKQPVSVLVIIHDPDFNILLLERADAPNFWQSVTGSMEQNEPLLYTAQREVYEETGIDTQYYCPHNWHMSHDFEIYERWRHRYAPGTTYNTEHVFSLCIPHDTVIHIQPREHIQYIWLPIKEAADKVFSPSNQEAILLLPQKGICNVHTTAAS
ncbi:dihydroneopterin triphosphate diphosphatase [Neisseria sp. Ec49-e6-T10]|uniref:dihydroneopterin triphosphate diphosphatase n=1 Tax=Neisseria sp. Ec49-e6-T10 TaxID=3140744 RepID=UPI003EC1531B